MSRRPPKKRVDYMAQADALFSKLIRSRGVCESDRPSHSGNLQCAHIITRGYKSIRTLEEKALCLCQGCHVYFTFHPLEWELFIESRFPGRMGMLRERALKYERVDWRVEVKKLKASVGSVVNP